MSCSSRTGARCCIQKDQLSAVQACQHSTKLGGLAAKHDRIIHPEAYTLKQQLSVPTSPSSPCLTQTSHSSLFARDRGHLTWKPEQCLFHQRKNWCQSSHPPLPPPSQAVAYSAHHQKKSPTLSDCALSLVYSACYMTKFAWGVVVETL